MAYLLIGFPLLMAAITFTTPSNRYRPWFLPLGGAAHLALVLSAIFQPEDYPPITDSSGWLQLDAVGKVILGFLAVLFFLCSLYAPAYLAFRSDRPNRIF